MARRWIRLDVEWDTSEWVCGLEPAAQLAWVKLLCWMKVHGKAGRCRALADIVAAKRWDLPVHAVRRMLLAGTKCEAMKCDEGEWVVTKWALYQEPDPTSTARKRKQRIKSVTGVPDVTGGHGVTSGTDGVTRHVTTDHRPLTETAASSGARPREATGPPNMRSDLEEFLAGAIDAQDRKRIAAQGELLVSGEDRKAWETETGSTVPAEDRPELFRLALGFHRDGTQKALRSSVRYAVKLYALNGAEKPAMEGMNRAERKLAESIAKLRGIDLETAFR